MAEEKELTKEERAEKWKEYVREEVNSYLDAFLDLAGEGNIGVKYVHPNKAVYEDGTSEPDTAKAEGVQLLLNFKFEKALFFTDEEGFTK